MTNSNTNKYIALFALIITSTLSTLSTDLYAPIQPHMPDALNASAEKVKLTVSLYFLASSALLLIYGPLSERFGRRPVLITGIVVFAITSILSGLVTSVEQLIVLRVLQGMAAGAETLLVLAIIRDYFVDREQVKVLSIYRAACGLSPMFAPILGVIVFEYFGWRASFFIVGAISSLVALLLWKYLAESNTKRVHSLNLLNILNEYKLLIFNVNFLALSLVFVTSIGFFIIFHSAVPFVVHTEIGMPVKVFAYLQAGFMIAFIIGNVAANRLMKFISVDILLAFSVVLVVIANIILWSFIVRDNITIYTLAIPILILAFANGPIMSAVPTLAMDVTKASPGSSSAMLLTIVSVLGSLAAVIEGRIQATYNLNVSVSIAITLSALAALAFISLLASIYSSSSSIDPVTSE
ncbi:MFS transporter [Colwelliaceae bacterium 6441]